MLIAELWEEGTAGIAQEEGGIRAFFDDTIPQQAILLKFGIAQARTEPDPAAPVRDDWEPVFAGSRFFITPPWHEGATPEARFRIALPYSQAFGSGRHETTQLCMEALERYLQPGCCVADIGCGSGILLMAAKLLGAGRLIGCDIDEGSVLTARKQADGEFFIGSADGLQSGIADLVLANITASVLDHIAGDVQRICNSTGLIILSGFLSDRTPVCFRPLEVLVMEDWQCWICRPTDVNPGPEAASRNLHLDRWWL